FKTFASISGGWVFTQEEFLESVTPVVNFGKLRFSYGNSGNNVGLGDFDYVGTIGKGTTQFGVIPATQVATSYSGLISYDRTWERVEQKNFGIDLNFLDSRLRTSF